MSDHRSQNNDEDDARRKDDARDNARREDHPTETVSRRKSKRTSKEEGFVSNIDKLKLVDLRDELRKLGLPSAGNKSQLKARLQSARPGSEREGSEKKMADDKETEDDKDIEDDKEAGDEDITSDESMNSDNTISDEDDDNRMTRNMRERVSANKMQRRRDTRSSVSAAKKHERITTRRFYRHDDDNVSSDADTDVSIRQRRNVLERVKRHSADEIGNYFTIKDVEGSLSYFTGDDKLPIEHWISEFEDMSALLKWSDLQKLIYGKRMLKGSAKRFVSFEKGITSWDTLKRRLKREFKVRLNSAVIHSQLYKRKQQSNESSRQYIYAMQEIADQGFIEEDALVQYIIDGVQDDECNKTVLYNATTVRELKKCFEVYDRMKERRQRRKTVTKKDDTKDNTKSVTKTRVKSGAKSVDKKHCFNCGSTEHDAKNCANADKGPKCFKCNEYGHIAPKCSTTSRQPEATVSVVTRMRGTDDKCLPININGREYRALVDTGSEVSLMRHDIYNEIGKPKLTDTTRLFTGLGNVSTKPSGTFCLKFLIQEDTYEAAVYVMPTQSMVTGVILGCNFLDNTDVVIRKGRVEVKRPTAEVTNTTIDKETTADTDDPYGNQTGFEELAMSCIATEEIDVTEPYRSRIEAIITATQPRNDVETAVETRITLRDETPVYLHPRRLAPKEKSVVDKQISEWLESGIIKPSRSEYASPIVVVRKKDGSHRVCVDYRALNKKMIRDKYPMPRVDDIIDGLVDFRVFSIIDLKNGFFHVPVEAKSQKYTAFVTHNGQYEFTKTPFGLCNSPTSFLRFIDKMFHDLSRKKIIFMYMDDIIIPGRDEEDAFNKLTETLTVAADNGLNINWRKCKFLQKRVEFLGNIIEDGCVRPSPAKVQAVQNFPQPKSFKQLRSFMGLTSYFRRFVKDYAKLAYPLYEVKDEPHFYFGLSQLTAFNSLKDALSREPVLRIYDPSAITELHTDASKQGLGAVLLQRKVDEKDFYPVYYLSNKTTDAEKKWCSYELEILAIVKAIKKFRVYLLGIKFKIVTDCQAFQKTLNKEDLPPKVARWALTLEEFDYEIEHRAGKCVQHVDALSRYPIMVVQDTVLTLIESEQNKEERLHAIKQLLTQEPYKDYVIENGLLMKKLDDRTVIVLPSSMQYETLRKAHENGHFGAKKMIESIQQDYYIPKLKEKIESFIECCIPCILSEKKKGKREGELRPIPKGDVPLSTYHLDHLGPMTSTSKLYKHLLVIVDGFSKFVWLYPTKTTNTKEVLDKLTSMQQIFGNPRRVITDRGTAFTSSDFSNYCNAENVEHVAITTGVPRGNGQVERINRIIIPVLTKLSLDNPDRWYKHVSKLQQCLNSTYQRSVGMSPFEVLFGVRMRHCDDSNIISLLDQEYVQLFDKERDNLRDIAKRNISKIQAENKRYYNKRRKKARLYKEGDPVVIRRTQFAPGLKIKRKFLGPYRVSRVLGNDRYEVTKTYIGEGPEATMSSADNMKPYRIYSSGTEDLAGLAECRNRISRLRKCSARDGEANEQD